MPIYEYNCSNCRARVELLVWRSSDTPICPECGAVLTDKLLSVPAVLGDRSARLPGHTCCGQEERCSTPPCSVGAGCRHER